jgi:hypothetical protein
MATKRFAGTFIWYVEALSTIALDGNWHVELLLVGL